MKLTEHFDESEAACRDGTLLPAPLRPYAVEVATELEVLRADQGIPIVPNSWYRTAEWNRHEGGAPGSLHLLARAVDFRMAGRTPEQVYGRIEELIAAGKMKEGGLGLYPSRKRRLFPPREARVGWVHYDTRGTRARWRG
jgi:uncharacterized protein YcbK (DUF882 family)